MLHLGPLLHLRPQQYEPEPILCGVVSPAMQMLIQQQRARELSTAILESEKFNYLNAVFLPQLG